MTIDFTQLLRDEKRKARSKKAKKLDAPCQKPPDIQEASKKEAVEIEKRIPLWQHDGHTLRLALELPTVTLDQPSSIRYFDSSISELGETGLSTWLSQLQDSDDGVKSWKTMKHGKRRVALFAAAPSLPKPLQDVADSLVRNGIFPESMPPNHVLINEYLPGQGIMPHTDGPSYLNCTATLSLGSAVLLNFTKRIMEQNGEDASTQNAVEILLNPRSLLVFSKTAYSDFCHGIAPDILDETVSSSCVNCTEGTRIERKHRFSLTFRHKYDNTTML